MHKKMEFLHFFVSLTIFRIKHVLFLYFAIFILLYSYVPNFYVIHKQIFFFSNVTFIFYFFLFSPSRWNDRFILILKYIYFFFILFLYRIFCFVKFHSNKSLCFNLHEPASIRDLQGCLKSTYKLCSFYFFCCVFLLANGYCIRILISNKTVERRKI